MKHGFILRRLSLTGPGVPAARLDFTRGLNVVVGPSDTGKTFIAQCIDHAMGSGGSPKAIPEAQHYRTASLEIESQRDARIFVLERSLSDGDIRLTTNGQADRILAPKHAAGREDTVSRFLLGLSGLDDKKVRTNQSGTTRPLSFRDIARLVLVDEESVIAADSPVLSGQYTMRTVETSVFRLLLTGADDSAVIAREDPKVSKGRQEGKVEVLEALLERTRGAIKESEGAGTIAEERERLARLDAAAEAASAELVVEQKSAAVLEEKRRAVWTRLRQVESRANVLAELQKRFDLLQAQYVSDLRRLDAINEAGVRLEQIKEERCAVCGALPEHHDAAHRNERASPADVVQACRAEAVKTTKLMQDLQATRTATAADVERLTIERNARQAELNVVVAELKLILEARVQVAVSKVQDARDRRDACGRRLELFERVAELELLLAEAKAPRKRERADGPALSVSAGQAEQFSKDVEALLRSWRFPDLGRVTFSEDNQDVVITGRPRGSHGKGVRAITRAAFNLALLRLCAREERPFPGFVLIDSPLVVYREPDTNEGAFPLDVKNAFYESIAAGFNDVQVVILENDEPPNSVRERANLIVFTGSNQGRAGFLPAVAGA